MKHQAILIGMILAAVSAFAADAPSPLQINQKDPSKAPKIYVIPMGLNGNGQIGTDIRLSIYEKVAKDVKEKKPDLIIFQLESADVNRRDYLQDDDRAERGRMDFEDARKMVSLLKDDLGGIPQVMWVKDSVGFSTALALAWPDLYMSSNARLWGMARVMEFVRHPDHEVVRKFLAAWTGIANGFLRRGGYPPELGLAMMRPEKTLSVSWDGRNLIWRDDTKGTFLVDGDEKAVANFDAKTAEDLGLCDGIADSVEDLMFLLGYREWDDSLGKSNQDGVKIVSDYIAEWRKAYTKSIESFGEYEKNQQDPKKINSARQSLEKVRDTMKKYPAVEFRWKLERGVDMNKVDTLILELKEKGKSNTSGGSGGLRR
ncbi:MAG: hypothetical protein K8R92_10830 [Planctomycetes bacterium]|nr:hypothetical protein [Planctomycetota bacterium]